MAQYSYELLHVIYHKTRGYCRHCGKKLAFGNYGNRRGLRGAWQVDHGTPKSRGGTDRLNNCHPACIPCNREKGDMTTTEYRRCAASPAD